MPEDPSHDAALRAAALEHLRALVDLGVRDLVVRRAGNGKAASRDDLAEREMATSGAGADDAGPERIDAALEQKTPHVAPRKKSDRGKEESVSSAPRCVNTLGAGHEERMSSAPRQVNHLGSEHEEAVSPAPPRRSLSLEPSRVIARDQTPEVVRNPIQEGLFVERVEVPSDADPRELLESLRQDEIGDCTRCRLAGGRKTIVFGSGNPAADLMFVGEGPGADEDAQGLPFVGKAGQLLTKMIGAMIVSGRPLSRDEVYIANIIKCRPPGNRDPEPDEIAACEGFLFRQIAIIKPRVIIALGAFAARTLLRSKAPISALRGRFHEYRGTLLMPTFHPAYVLRNYTEATRRTVFEDLKKAAAELERNLVPR